MKIIRSRGVNRRIISKNEDSMTDQNRDEKEDNGRARRKRWRSGRNYCGSTISNVAFLVLLFMNILMFVVRKKSRQHQSPIDSDGKLSPLTSLRPIDYEKYTIRINTWRRPKQLLHSIKHHASCEGVAEIQIVWCDTEEEPSKELMDLVGDEKSSPLRTKLVIERHEVNSLNERFRVLETPSTLGILSIDDDVLRPCEAIDSGFFKWIKSPDRMVGFDARTHTESEDDGTWKYGYLSTTQKENQYSAALTRFSFLHVDYMHRYMRDLPQPILDMVAKNFECEDIAMSFLISSLTQGQPPLLAECWAIKTLLKMKVDNKISSNSNHKESRDQCVETFASMLGLKKKDGDHRLRKEKFVRKENNVFLCGPDVDQVTKYKKSAREKRLRKKLKKVRSSGGQSAMQDFILKLKEKAGRQANEKGLLETSLK